MTRQRTQWRRCRRLAAAVPMPVPFDQDRFLAAIAAERGRPIEVLPVPAADVPCGLLLSTDAADYIFVPAGTTTLHRQHILFHEIAHLLCRHVGGRALPTGVLPGLSPELIDRVLGRSTYTEPQEREAELVATFLTQRATRPAKPAYAGDLRALDEAFGGNPR
jgi:hypothetical protein